MLRKNVASQVLTFNLVNATTGAALTGATVTTKVALDGSQSASAGTLTELGTGQYKYVPTQGETNGTSVGFSFTATNAVPVNLHCFTLAADPTDAVRFGLTALPNAAAEAAGGLYTRGSGAGQIKQTNNGEIDSNATHVNNVATTSVTTVAAVVGTTIAPTFTGSLIKADVTDWNGTAVTAPNTAGTPVVDVGRINNVATTPVTTVKAVQGLAVDGVVTTVTNQLTAAQVATGIWQDTTAGDFTTAASVGKSVMNGVALGTGLTVASVSGAVGSVTGNVGGSTASVTAAVAITSNIKKNQALAKFQFLMTDSTTHAPKTGVSVTVTRSIDGGAFGAGALSAVTEISNGTYTVDFAAGDLNGNVIVLRATGASSDDTFERIVTQP